MQAPQALAIFSEDIRSEATGQDTIIGTLPDNLTVPLPSGMAMPPNAVTAIPKIGIYVRVNLDSNGTRPKSVAFRLLSTESKIIGQSQWSQSLIDKAFDDAKASSMPLAGLILKVVSGPVLVPKPGQLVAIVTIDGSDIIAGSVNVILPTS